MIGMNLDKLRDYLSNPIIKKIAITIFVVLLAIFFCIINGNKENEGYVITDQGEKDNVSEVVTNEIYVDIDGCVASPGVYKVEHGTRLYEIIEMAGGATSDGNVTNINRAKEVKDGEKIIIPKIGESYTENGLINLNLADANKLEELTGIGPVTAQMIINYRNENNGFDSIEDILKINGIGTATYNKIKKEITV
ncbi:MAG TPA: ComEA family DNA-binding protein [Anaerovoracaceae bacterium]|nr:ComEA family DNA-binding protein [Anaerovoracaceae bacterium]